MRSRSAHKFIRSVLAVFFVTVTAESILAQTSPANSMPNGHLPLSPLRVSASGHSIERADGQPFFWLADTGWYVLSRLSSEESAEYLATRQRQGFSLIQLMALPRGGTPVQPRSESDPELVPNEEFYRKFDRFLDQTEAIGLYVVIVVASKGEVRAADRPNARPPLVNSRNARGYARFLAKRYGGRPGIVWALGGDFLPINEQETAAIYELAAGLKEGGATQLIAYHPKGTTSSASLFHEREWLDINMCQSAHSEDFPIWNLIAEDRARVPPRPVLDGESLYERIPCPLWRATPETPLSTAYQVRRPIYAAVFSGACGATYGANGIYQFTVPGNGPARGERAIPHWREGLFYPAATQMIHLRNLMLSRPHHERVPDQKLIASDPFNKRDRITAIRDVEGTYALIYSAGGKPFTVDTSRLIGTAWRASWYDPRTGEVTSAGQLNRDTKLQWVPPVQGDEMDWILILDDVAKDYALPSREELKE